MELMETPTWHRLNNITKDLPWREDLASLRDELLAKGLTDDIRGPRLLGSGRVNAQSASALR